MANELYQRFSTALISLPETDLLDTLARIEHAITDACRTTTPDAIFVPVGETGKALDAILGMFAGRRVGELAEVWGRLRNELADELARRGAPADIVRELREGLPSAVGVTVH